MKAIDKIKNYIQKEKNQGCLKPGDILPSYHRMMDLTGASYATVSSAMVRLEKEGVVDIRNGKGSFLAGARPLNVIIYSKAATIPFRILKDIFDKNVRKNNLHINVELKNFEEMSPLGKNPDAKASISIVPFSHDRFAGLSHPGNEFVASKYMDEISAHSIGLMMPFNVFSYQMGANQTIFDRIGFNVEHISNDFKWWPAYVKKCRQNKIVPAAMCWFANTTWHFNILLPLLFSLAKNINPDFDFVKRIRPPFFDSAIGRLFFKILKDCYLHDSPADLKSFYRNGAGLHFQTGSWICVQNGNPERPDIKVDGLRIIPYRYKNRKICALQQSYLLPAFADSINTEEKKRVKKLLDMMLSREFQLEYCNISGAISQRSDILPLDYSWNANGRFSDFFPDKDDYVFFEGLPAQSSAISCLTVFVEEFCMYKAPMESTLKKMDRKIY